MSLARSYLKKKDIIEIQIYDDISSSFYELEVLFLTALMISLYLIHPKDIVIDNPQISDFHIPIRLFVFFATFRILNGFQSWLTQRGLESHAHKDSEKRKLKRNTNIKLLYGRLSTLFLLLTFISISLLIIPVSIDYTPNLKNILGTDFVYSPILFGLLTYSSAYVESRYSMLEKMTIIQNLYTVAIAEGDVEDD